VTSRQGKRSRTGWFCRLRTPSADAHACVWLLLLLLLCVASPLVFCDHLPQAQLLQ
jgi:hypothetical protein